MLKLQYSCTNILPTKIHQELIDANIVGFNLTHDADCFTLVFPELRKLTSAQEEGEPTIIYQARTYETVIVDEVETQVEVWEEVDLTALFSSIDGCISSHDPTPITPAKTEMEMIKSDQALLMKDILKLKGVI